MTLTTLNDNQPEWVKRELGLEEYKEFKLGQKVKFSDDWVYIIHIQEDKTGEVLFRGMLPNGASITMLYDLINKPVETTKEQPEKYKLKEWFLDQIEEIKDKYGYMQKHYTPMAMSITDESLCMLFNGMELILLNDGTYILGDTTGG
jgi:hypothetical protein